MKCLCLILLVPLLQACALRWEDDQGYRNTLGFNWSRQKRGEGPQIQESRVIGGSLELGAQCVSMNLGWSEQIRIEYAQDEQAWHVEYAPAAGRARIARLGLAGEVAQEISRDAPSASPEQQQ